MKKLFKNKKMLIYVKALDLSREDIEYETRAEIFEDTIYLVEDADKGFDYLATNEYGVEYKHYTYIPERALKKYYKIMNTLGNLNYYCAYDRQLAEQLNNTLTNELERLWTKYTTPTWFRRNATAYVIPTELPF